MLRTMGSLTCDLSRLRAALLCALGLSACTSRPLDDLGMGDPATTSPPGTTTANPTTGGPGAPGTTAADPTTATDTTTAGATTTAASAESGGGGGGGNSGGTTTTADLSTSGTTVDATTDTTGTPDLPCVKLDTLGVDLMAGEVLDLPGCEAVPSSDCYDYIKICAPRPDGVQTCEECAPDCVGPLPNLCNGWITPQSVCGPFAEGEQCCHVYQYNWNCTDGRPFCIEGEARTAPPVAGAAWTDRATPALLAELAPAERAGLAALWAADGLAEHASVAAFARFTLQLLALGAPPELVADACRAQLDEVAHARTTLALAAAYGRPIGPGMLPIADALAAPLDRESVLVATFIEGCVGETIAAAELELAAQSCADAAVAATLRRLAADEQRHAALAWRTVQWLLRAGGPALRGALALALARVCGPAAGVDELPAALLLRHGRLPAAGRAALARHCLHAVIRPCATALLAADPPSARASA